ncbi:hypothetical protein UNDKW_5750 [Undibacterium sp. KW1]|nr:hypothetical protein UNDKW_5750 [Undibacterium sp. KW1]
MGTGSVPGKMPEEINIISIDDFCMKSQLTPAGIFLFLDNNKLAISFKCLFFLIASLI